MKYLVICGFRWRARVPFVSHHTNNLTLTATSSERPQPLRIYAYDAVSYVGRWVVSLGSAYRCSLITLDKAEFHHAGCPSHCDISANCASFNILYRFNKAGNSPCDCSMSTLTSFIRSMETQYLNMRSSPIRGSQPMRK